MARVDVNDTYLQLITLWRMLPPARDDFPTTALQGVSLSSDYFMPRHASGLV